MKTASAKAKARRLQDRLRDVILEHFPSLTKDDVKPAIMGEGGIDVKLSAEARRVFPYAIEAKNRETINVWQTIAQAEENATKEGLKPVFAILRNRMKEPWVGIPLSEWMRLVSTPQTIHLGPITDPVGVCDHQHPLKPPGVIISSHPLTEPCPLKDTYDETMQRSHRHMDSVDPNIKKSH